MFEAPSNKPLVWTVDNLNPNLGGFTEPQSNPNRPELIRRLRVWQDDIPNLDRLIHKVDHNRTPGHILHALVVLRLCENQACTITDIENSDGDHDIDIQLDDRINIQCWYGGSVATNIVENESSDKGRKLNEREQNITSLGGVKTDPDKDEATMLKKLEQLPDDKVGVVLVYSKLMGLQFLMDCQLIHHNKCVLNINHTSGPMLYHSDRFRGMAEAERLISYFGMVLAGHNIT